MGSANQMLQLAVVPQKLVKKIINREFVDMSELLPASWRLDTEAGSSSHSSKHPRHGPVKQIKVWAECFVVYAAILVAAYPDKGPHLFAYLRSIVRASRQFEDTAWVSIRYGIPSGRGKPGLLGLGSAEPRPLQRCIYRVGKGYCQVLLLPRRYPCIGRLPRGTRGNSAGGPEPLGGKTNSTTTPYSPVASWHGGDLLPVQLCTGV